VKKEAAAIKVVMVGVGAAGTACMLMLRDLGVRNIIGCDRRGALYAGRDGMNDAKTEFAAVTNADKVSGILQDVLAGADVFIGLSGPNLLEAADVQTMAQDPIVFAMSNPDPEISPEEAGPHVAVIATGRSDYPNQINNVLCFPGLFRGCLDCQTKDITDKMKMAAAEAIAGCITDAELCADYVIPSVFDQRIATAVAEAVAGQARAEGLARR
jgi:malate dehydrogenase (oxaloacetate-decarboxylating)